MAGTRDSILDSFDELNHKKVLVFIAIKLTNIFIFYSKAIKLNLISHNNIKRRMKHTKWVIYTVLKMYVSTFFQRKWVEWRKELPMHSKRLADSTNYAVLSLLHGIYCLSEKSGHMLYCNLLYIMGQDFLDIPQYLLQYHIMAFW